jgi:hypothetical protein
MFLTIISPKFCSKLCWRVLSFSCIMIKTYLRSTIAGCVGKMVLFSSTDEEIHLHSVKLCGIILLINCIIIYHVRTRKRYSMGLWCRYYSTQQTVVLRFWTTCMKKTSTLRRANTNPWPEPSTWNAKVRFFSRSLHTNHGKCGRDEQARMRLHESWQSRDIG